MRNPLIKRIPRELKSEFGKQIAVFLFYVMIIGTVSGFIVADDSLIRAYNESFEKYNIEDGNFELLDKAEQSTLDSISEEGGITVYENFYKQEETLSFDSKLRIFGERDEIDRVCLMEDDMPAADNEIAVDRLYAQNHKLEKGSVIELDGAKLTVSGIVAFSDYSALFENPTDLMFDNDKFGIGIMTDEGFEKLRDNHIHYSYSWLYDKKPADDTEAKDMAEELVNVISGQAVMTNFIPEFSNQAIIFTGNDMGGDRNSILAFLYITVVILAFIFSITIDSTITAEAGVIGTLRASGYTRGELLRHYLIIPMTTLILGAIFGNILGYTWLEKYMALAYYNSYSLTTYDLRFNSEAFILTTIIPLAIMFVINVITLMVKLRLSPLRFLRHDLGRRKKKKAFRLNTKLPIMTRFRLRIIFQNLPNYITIVIGTFLANAILLFGMIFEPMLQNYQDTVAENMIAQHIYILKADTDTADETAEKGLMTGLNTTYEQYKSEEISVYGVAKNSRYIAFDHDADGVFLSTAYREKYDISEGDSITLKTKYGDNEYSFMVSGFYDYPATLAVFMDIDRFSEQLKDESASVIILSDNKLTDIDDRLIAATISEDDLTKTSRQLTRSMGSIMTVFSIFGVIMFVLVIYLLAKIIIEKNAQSISMTKILGYTPREINGLYIHSTSFVAIASILFTIPFAHWAIGAIMKVVFMSYPGYFEYDVSPFVLMRAGAVGVIAYFAAAFLLTRKVKRIHLAEALKNVE